MTRLHALARRGPQTPETLTRRLPARKSLHSFSVSPNLALPLRPWPASRATTTTPHDRPRIRRHRHLEKRRPRPRPEPKEPTPCSPSATGRSGPGRRGPTFVGATSCATVTHAGRHAVELSVMPSPQTRTARRSTRACAPTPARCSRAPWWKVRWAAFVALILRPQQVPLGDGCGTRTARVQLPGRPV